MLYTIVKKCTNYDEVDDEKKEDQIDLSKLIKEDMTALSQEEAKKKKKQLIKGKI